MELKKAREERSGTPQGNVGRSWNFSAVIFAFWNAPLRTPPKPPPLPPRRSVFKADPSCHLPRESRCVCFADIKMVMIGERLRGQLTTAF